jgi:hypothetical protein
MVLIFTAPLVCWALLARTAKNGEEVGAALACCVLLEVAAAKGWLFGGVRVTLITTLSALTIAIPAWGAVREHGQGAPPLLSDARGFVGLALSGIYCLVCGLACAYVIVQAGDDMPARTLAPISSVLPLSPGIAVVSDTALCRNQAGNSCMRYITLRDTLGRPSQVFEGAVSGDLEREHAWHFGSDGVAWRADGGWALDRQTMSAWVESQFGGPFVVVYLETDNG